MGIRAKPTVPQHDVAGLQGRRRSSRLGPSRGSATGPSPSGAASRCRRRTAPATWPPGSRSPGAGCRAGRRPLELGVVGHREARAVDDPDAMAEPARRRRRWRPGASRRSAPAAVEDGQRQPLAGLAVGAVGEGPAAEVDDMPTGGVAVEDLEEEEVDGGDRVEEAFPPGVVGLAAGVLDGLPGPGGRRGLDAVGRGWGRCAVAWEGSVGRLCEVVSNPQDARSPSHAQEAINVQGQRLSLSSWHSGHCYFSWSIGRSS